MRFQRVAPIVFGAAFSAAACQLVWSYDDFGLKPGSASGGAGGTASTTSSRSSSHASSTASSGGGAPSSSSSSSGECKGSASSSSGDAGCAEGGPLGMACADCCDQAIIAARRTSLQSDLYGCVVPGNIGNQSGAQACLEKSYGYSAGCAYCWAAEGECAVANCSTTCGLNPNSKVCDACLAKNCDPNFIVCSGMDRPAAIDAGADAP